MVDLSKAMLVYQRVITKKQPAHGRYGGRMALAPLIGGGRGPQKMLGKTTDSGGFFKGDWVCENVFGPIDQRITT